MHQEHYNVGELEIVYRKNENQDFAYPLRYHRKTRKTIVETLYSKVGNVSETVYALFLSSDYRVLGYSKIGQGNLTSSVMDVQLMLFTALKLRAAGVVVVHNHPVSAAPPSEEDVEAYHDVRNACEAVHLTLVDFIVYSGNTLHFV